MGVVGCDNDTVPHGHGGGKVCSECGVPYYKVHPHSKVCSKGTPVMNDVKHDEYHLERQMEWEHNKHVEVS